ncbi:MAG: PAS domain-containing protein [Gammaproteobacteria bacterium]|nr:PAS domain-containing protein [Gammaproteobacteria bacterium]
MNTSISQELFKGSFQHSLLEQLSTSVLLLDLSGRFQYLNSSAEKAFGITARNLIGKRYSYFIEAESLPVRDWLNRLENSETRLIDLRTITFKNNLAVEVELALQKIHLDNQDYLLIEWQNSSLSKKHQQEQEVFRQQQIQQQLLKNLAHEIKTPLSGIAGAAQLLTMSDNSEFVELSQIVNQEVKRLTKLVDRMLLGQKKASRILMNIHEVIEDVLNFIGLKAPVNLKLKRDYDPSLPELSIAPEQIYQVLLNLLQNSLDATNKTNTPEIIIKTRISKEHPLVNTVTQAIVISVIDNGSGIPKEMQPNIFFPMISGKNSSGLGLGIAQSLIRQHQGLIEFDSQVGQTSFHCYLPLNLTELTNG